MTREEELNREGWTKRFLACEPRLSESVELYQSLGFEVHLELLPENPDTADCGECRVCFEQDRERYRYVYTRKVDASGDDDIPP